MTLAMTLPMTLATALLTWTVAGCGGGDNGNGGGTGGNGGSGDGGAGSGGSGGDMAMMTSPPDLADDGQGRVVPDGLANMVIGSYAMQSKTSATQEVPILGKMMATTTALALVDIARDGQGLKMTEQGCHVTVVGSMAAMTTIPDAIPRSVPPTASPLEVWQANGQTLWKKPAVTVTVGVHLTAPDSDALPTTQTDPRVWDQDGDGNPGVTVMVSGLVSGNIYVVQRQRAIYSGAVTGQNALGGTVLDASDQSVIGATNSTLNQNIKTTPDPDLTKSPIAFVKLDTAYDCTKLVSDAAKLFP
jgi:hypothetical protein